MPKNPSSFDEAEEQIRQAQEGDDMGPLFAAAPRARTPDAFMDKAPTAPHSETSAAAARALSSKALNGQAAVVLNYIESRGPGGATREEIAVGCAIRLSAVCGRVNSLYRAGRIGSNGARRAGSSGALQEVMLHERYVTRWNGGERCRG